MEDRLIRAIVVDKGIKISAVTMKNAVERARQIHRTLPVATAALGRTLCASSMMGAELKAEDGSITIQFKSKGPLGSIVTVSDCEGNVRGYVHNPCLDLPLRESDGKLDVGRAVGPGYLTVIKDVGMKDPVSGTVALVNGEIAEDLAQYFAESEQVPSAVALGVLVDRDQSVKQAGGYIVQLMPGVDDESITKLEQNIAKAGAVTSMLEEDISLEDMVSRVLEGFEVEFLQNSPVSYHCNCSKTRVEKALVSMGRQELMSLADKEEDTEVTCQFCDQVYRFTPEELKTLVENAVTKK